MAVGAVSVGSTLLGLPRPPVPPGTDGLVQILLGMMVGLRIDRDSLRSGAHDLVPASLLAVVTIDPTIVLALIAAPLTSASVVTTIFAAAPGGLAQMAMVGASFGADRAAVITVQLIRLLLAVTIVNVLLGRLGSKGEPEPTPRHQQEQDDEEEQQDGEEQQDDAPAGRTGYKEDLKRFGVAAPWGILGGVIGFVIWAPAGGIIGALLGSAAFGLLTGRPVPVGKFQIGVQALSGGVIGLGISSNFLSELAKLAGAGALIIFAQMLLWAATSWMLVKLFGYDLPTSALASSPGGISGVLPAAGQAGTDTMAVTLAQLLRLSTIVVVVPVFVALAFGR